MPFWLKDHKGTSAKGRLQSDLLRTIPPVLLVLSPHRPPHSLEYDGHAIELSTHRFVSNDQTGSLELIL